MYYSASQGVALQNARSARQAVVRGKVLVKQSCLSVCCSGGRCLSNRCCLSKPFASAPHAAEIPSEGNRTTT